MSFRTFRIAVLLLLLLVVGGITVWESWLVRAWHRPLQVAIYPINGDGDPATAAYLAQLDAGHFAEIGAFLQREAARHRLKPLPEPHLVLESTLAQAPPAAPPGPRSTLDAIRYSLALRYYAFRLTSFRDNLGRVRLFVIYQQGEPDTALAHSLGLQKGLVGVVHVYAQSRQDAQNNVVITHELLHTLGASDKYGADGQPRFPEGYADPEARPRYPQHAAEIMAGRIAHSSTHAVIPASLAECVVGPQTAYEINW